MREGGREGGRVCSGGKRGREYGVGRDLRNEKTPKEEEKREKQTK